MLTDADRTKLFCNAMDCRMQNFQRLVTLCHLVLQSQAVGGEVVEIGTYSGKTAALLASLTNKPMTLIDSFEGLSVPGPHDTNKEPFVAGAIKSTPEEVLNYFEQFGLPKPNIIKSWVADLKMEQLPEKLAFVMLDVDLYEPTLAALKLVWPRLQRGGTIAVDDFCHPELPGVKAAVSEWSQTTLGLMKQPLDVNGANSIHLLISK